MVHCSGDEPRDTVAIVIMELEQGLAKNMLSMPKIRDQTSSKGGSKL